jgi:putative N6-adenine-specific DNA methylase
VKLVAKTLYGLEDLLAAELKAIGANHVNKGVRAVYFEGSKEIMYRANLECRTAIRILQIVHTFNVYNELHLYDQMKAFNWPHYLDLDQTFAVDAAISSKYFNHSKYVALKTKDALVDRFREEMGARPNVNVMTPTLRINVHIQDRECTLSMDSSGDSLHKRGYRIHGLDAPINEVLAAGMIGLSGWQGDRPFLDPMCGSGTMVIEAALKAYNIPSNLNRKSFGFQNWKNYDAALWEKIKDQARAAIKKEGVPIVGSDKNLRAIRAAEENIVNAGLQDKIQLIKKDFARLDPPFPNGIIITNPPYDERLVKDDINAFYKMIGDRLKQAYMGYEAWIISSNMEAFKHLGLKASRKTKLYNGALECRYQQYELYAGSKKSKHQTTESH